MSSTSMEEPGNETREAGEAKEASHSKWETGEVERERNNEGPDGGHHRV